MRSIVLYASVLLAIASAACSDDGGGSGGGIPDPAPLLVETSSGPVQGALLGTTRAFLGIPYAEPPVGALRWKAPRPHPPWAEPRQAIARGPSCAQHTPLDGAFAQSSSEDCLTLNVWAPERPEHGALPVFVWIHGGGYSIGSGGEPAYDGQRLSEVTGAVVVTVNYRLGPLGFLSMPELDAEDAAHPSSGNYGLEDQRAALVWIRDNAAAFSGDPAGVTIFGESAGGASVCQHMVSPQSQGLFARGVLQSGPCDLVTDRASASAQAQSFAAALGCQGAGVLACLRGKSTEEVVTALEPPTFSVGGSGVRWMPVVDGWFLPDRPSALLAAGAFHEVPVILGSNADEGTLFFALGGMMVADEAAFQMLAEDLVPGYGAEIVAAYPAAEYGSVHDAAVAAAGDAMMVCPTRRAARAIAAAGVPAYLYHFTYGPPSLFGDLGAFHSAEIKFVLGNPGQLLPSPLTPEEEAMSREVMGYWLRHARSGDPNGDGALAWPRYAAATDEHLIIDLAISAGAGLRREKCDFWDSLPAVAP